MVNTNAIVCLVGVEEIVKLMLMSVHQIRAKMVDYAPMKLIITRVVARVLGWY